jgi:predicted acylesterase/phospholipase RssA
VAETGTNWKRIEVGLVLQGGGALGAYEWGAIDALLDAIAEAEKIGPPITLRAVTGASIGAINAACLVGASSRTEGRERLASLWNELIIDTPPFWPPQIARDLSLYGLPQFYEPRYDLLTFSSWTYIYNTHPLLQTLADHVDFAALNASETAFVITAVDVERGTLQRFANQKIDDLQPVTITPEHVLASGSLPPQFPWTDIKSDKGVMHCWDGGIVDNTPLGDAIDAFDDDKDVWRMLVVMNLFPTAALLPKSLPEVSDRVAQLRFGNRTQQDARMANRINALISTILKLADLAPGELPGDLAGKVDAARAYKLITPVQITLEPAASDPNGFRDYSRSGVQHRRARGYELASAKLTEAFKSIPNRSS